MRLILRIEAEGDADVLLLVQGEHGTVDEQRSVDNIVVTAEFELTYTVLGTDVGVELEVLEADVRREV